MGDSNINLPMPHFNLKSSIIFTACNYSIIINEEIRTWDSYSDKKNVNYKILFCILFNMFLFFIITLYESLNVQFHRKCAIKKRYIN